VAEKEKSSLNVIHRQRSSKSSKKSPPRQQTGKTLTTNRCVSSPLSVHGKKNKIYLTKNFIFIIIFIEEAERFLAIKSFKGEEDDDDNNTQATIINAPEETSDHNALPSAKIKSDNENGI
jgi:hypothetical protein